MTGRAVVLTGGVGGAKLVLGLCGVMPPGDVTAIINTGDDFNHLGLAISPDIDTLLYTLSGKANAAQGWGRADESWTFMAAAKSLGAPGWFQLGDGDLALHVLRTQALAQGKPLSDIIARFARAWNIAATLLPMTDAPVATHLTTDAGELSFQDYFVARQCMPAVRAISFLGAAQALPAPGVLDAINSPFTEAILIAPSNPYLSIDPILAIPGIAEALQNAAAPVIAVSPLIAGQAVKGPTAKLMRELGVEAANSAIAAHYRGKIDAILIHDQDTLPAAEIAVARCDTLMHSLADRRRVAGAALALAARVRKTKTRRAAIP